MTEPPKTNSYLAPTCNGNRQLFRVPEPAKWNNTRNRQLLAVPELPELSLEPRTCSSLNTACLESYCCLILGLATLQNGCLRTALLRAFGCPKRFEVAPKNGCQKRTLAVEHVHPLACCATKTVLTLYPLAVSAGYPFNLATCPQRTLETIRSYCCSQAGIGT